jgi:hypothetical protein
VVIVVSPFANPLSDAPSQKAADVLVVAIPAEERQTSEVEVPAGHEAAQ